MNEYKSKLHIKCIAAVETIIGCALNGKIEQVEFGFGSKEKPIRVRLIAVPEGKGRIIGDTLVLQVKNDLGEIKK